MPRKTKYNLQWESKFEWLSTVNNDEYSAYCKLCHKSFKIDGSGVSQVQKHAQGEKHHKLALLSKSATGRRDISPEEQMSSRHRDRDRRERSSERNRTSSSRRSLERHTRIDREAERMNRLERERADIYNYDRADRGYDRERELEREREYCARIREQERRHNDPSYHSPYDHTRHEDHHFMEIDDRYNENSRDDRISLEAREYPDDPRALNWDLRDERELDQRHYGREDSRPPSLKGREWDVSDYPDRDWDHARRSMDWDNRAAWNLREHECIPLEEEWRHYNRSLDNWPTDDRKRWQAEWREPREHSRPRSSLSHRGVIEEHSELLKKEPVKEDVPVSEIEDEAIKKESLSGKRPPEQLMEELIESKRPCLKEPILEDDLSEISDDADEILNREEEIQEYIEIQGELQVGPNSEKEAFQSQQQQTSGASQKSQSPSHTPNRLGKEDSLEEENIDLDFEEISEDELEEEARIKGLGDALGVDWASLVAESKPRVKPVSSAKRRWESHNVLVNLGISVEMTGEKVVEDILNEHITARIKEEKEDLEKNTKKQDNGVQDNFRIKEEMKNKITDKSTKTVKMNMEKLENIKLTEAELESLSTEKFNGSISHPVAAVQVCMREEEAIRRSLFTSAGPYKRALSARRDLIIRRHLCHLPIKDTFVETPKKHDPEMLKLATKLFERCL